ncbi:MAG: putative prenyltransferase [candidate division NC10 bacterium]|jgi:1,4-dihydroxy-2-naphthoate octaprenyltransferase|nr:putative prenyltransferase [candidate division NC10 bacterium]
MGVGPAAGECGAAADGGSAAIEKPPGCCGIQKIMREASGLLGPLRLPFLLLPLACVAAGAGAAFWRMGRLDWGTALLVLVGAVCAHASVNALNEYSDFRTGVDARTRRTPFSGGSGTLQRRPALAGYALGVGLVLAAITAVIGGYLALQVGPILFPLGVGGLAVVLLYTPWLNRNPALCLVAPGLGFGTCMVMGTDVVLGDGYSWTGFFASLVPFFLVSNLLLLNQFPDVEADRAGGRRHLVIAYGLRVGAVVYTLFHAGAFLSVVAGVALGFLPTLTLIALATLPLAALAARGAFSYADSSAAIVPALAMNVATTLLTPSLVAAGLFLARS